MATVNVRRVWLGTLAGGVVWCLWSILIEAGAIGMARYEKAIQAGYILAQPRYKSFEFVWFFTLFVLALVVARLYAAVRASWGAGPMTALRVGTLIGFAAGFPVTFSNSAWMPLPRIFAMWHMIELWVGAILAALVAGWLYRD
jgi:hypothetical protein